MGFPRKRDDNIQVPEGEDIMIKISEVTVEELFSLR